jgi:integrase
MSSSDEKARPRRAPGQPFDEFAKFVKLGTRVRSGPRRRLAMAKRKAKTSKDYERHALRFLAWLDGLGERATAPHQFDELLNEFLEELFDDSVDADGTPHNKSVAKRTCQAVQAFYPSLRGHLRLSWDAVKGWERLQPGVSYPPLTFPLAVLIGFHLARAGQLQMGLACVVAFKCLLRGSEVCGLRIADIGDVGDPRLDPVVYRHMHLRLRSAKTGDNQWVSVYDEHVRQLLQWLVADAAARRAEFVEFDGSVSERKIFNFRHADWRKAIHRVCRRLGLSERYVPHSLRHGGATELRVQGVSIETIMERGRWASSKSARRYIQSGPALALSVDVPARQAAHGTALASDVVYAFSRFRRRTE